MSRSIAVRTLAPVLVAAFVGVLAAVPVAADDAEAEAVEGPVEPLLGSDLAHTFSIVARDPATGDFGVAVQSHWFQVGTVVAWAEPGVGAVATQSFVEVSYGPKGLALMAKGKTSQEALAALVQADEQRSVRQVAFVDKTGRVAAWTGDKCIAEAGHFEGEGFSVQANMMLRDTVWPAMAEAYRDSKAPFAERLLAALDAAQAEGGDIRGRQSAALVIVSGTASETPWRDRKVDLRVDDHAEPLVELRRLLGVHRAYEESNAGDEAVALGDEKAALTHYAEAARLAPEIVELPFWQAVTLFSLGREEEAAPIFRRVFEQEPIWMELVRRLPASGLLPDDPKAIERILDLGPK
jgi:uncharacterized Ntn-hydrolase superfamily protein